MYFHKTCNYARSMDCCESGTQEGIDIPFYIIVGFQQGNRQSLQELSIGTFYRTEIRKAQCKMGTENYLDSGINLNCPDDDYTQGYQQTEEASKCLTKDILQLYKSDHDF